MTETLQEKRYRRKMVTWGLTMTGTAVFVLSLVGGGILAVAGGVMTTDPPTAAIGILIIAGGVGSILSGMTVKAILHGLSEILSTLGVIEEQNS